MDLIRRLAADLETVGLVSACARLHDPRQRQAAYVACRAEAPFKKGSFDVDNLREAG